MGREIERKFLLASDAWRREAKRSAVMRQGYLAGNERASIRVRVAGDEAWLNVKGAGLVANRAEYEYPISRTDAEEMLATLCERPLVEKTRYWVQHGGFTWEIDEFHGDNAGLVVAELELEEEAQSFPRAEWLGKEVTMLARYYNVNLVQHPYSAWNESERNP